MTNPIAPLSTYAAARTSLLGLAEQRGAKLSTVAHPLTGPDGETLATDVVRFGAPIGAADRVLLLLAGTHGVEGHAGSALQHDLVASGRLDALPDRTAVVLVHAVNPYGMAWSRRVDADNIDVNRNFLGAPTATGADDPDHAVAYDPAELPGNPLYDEVDQHLNPTDGEFDLADQSFLGELLEFYGRVGDHAAMKTLSGGQYTHPAGVQFGGTHTSWSRRTIERIWSEQLAGAHLAVNLDVHTGLGPMGRLTVFQTADDGESVAEMGDTWYPEHLFRTPRVEEDPLDHGLLGPGFDAWAAAGGPAGLETATFVLEYGTHDIYRGITAFRADNWLHHHGDPTDRTGREITRFMQEQFFVDDAGWRQDVADQGEMAIHTALDSLAGA